MITIPAWLLAIPAAVILILAGFLLYVLVHREDLADRRLRQELRPPPVVPPPPHPPVGPGGVSRRAPIRVEIHDLRSVNPQKAQDEGESR